MIIYESEWKNQMTVDDVIREFNRIKDEFCGDLEVYCWDDEMSYQPLKQINVKPSMTIKEDTSRWRFVVNLDTI